MNNHLDHIGPVARKNGLQLLLDFAVKFSEPVVLTGDFNFNEGCELYRQMTSGTLKDAKFAAKDSKGGITYNAFYPIKNKAEDMAIIDFINVSNDVDVIMKNIVGLYALENEFYAAADYNFDGVLDNRDLVLIAQKCQSQ